MTFVKEISRYLWVKHAISQLSRLTYFLPALVNDWDTLQMAAPYVALNQLPNVEEELWGDYYLEQYIDNCHYSPLWCLEDYENIVIWICNIFDNNFRIQNLLAKYLKESCW